MKIGDKVICRNCNGNKGTAVIIGMDQNGETAAILFLRPGLYNPEIVYKKDLELVNEN